MSTKIYRVTVLADVEVLAVSTTEAKRFAETLLRSYDEVVGAKPVMTTCPPKELGTGDFAE